MRHLKTMRILLSILIVKIVLAQNEDSIIVQLEQGPVRGHKDTEGILYSFLNIPYATAPTGVNKFKAPLSPPVWTEPHDVTDRHVTCIQPLSSEAIAALNLSVQEDCLVTNIYVPINASNLPVLVTIHGGAYQIGGNFINNFLGVTRSQRLIVVSFNYRLGVPGFLCLGTENIPGNAGLKDQVALLRWVQKNIASFGGNPNDVTIHGCSAGGGSVDFLTLSPMAAGLFQKAIIESGAFLGSVGPQVDPVHNAKIYAQFLNFTDVNDLSALEKFFTSASYELFLLAADFNLNSTDTLIRMSPCVERETGGERFLDDIPINIVKNGNFKNIPSLYGFAEMEGLIKINDFEKFKGLMNDKFSDFLPAELQFENESQREAVAARVKEFYFGNRNVSEETILSYVDYFTDMMFGYPMLRAANLRREAVNETIYSYLFKYSFADENTPYVPHTNVRGAEHCEQLFVLMDDRISSSIANHTQEYKNMRENIRKLWINFITTGNPTPEGSSLPSWLAVDSNNSPYMSLNNTLNLENSPMLEESVRLWDDIYEEHYRPPRPPSFPEAEPNSAAVSTLSISLLITLLCLNFSISIY